MVPPGQNAAMIANTNARALAQRQICERHAGAAFEGRISRARPQFGRSRRAPSYIAEFLRMYAAVAAL
jgi:hypothetical protein